MGRGVKITTLCWWKLTANFSLIRKTSFYNKKTGQEVHIHLNFSIILWLTQLDVKLTHAIMYCFHTALVLKKKSTLSKK